MHLPHFTCTQVGTNVLEMLHPQETYIEMKPTLEVSSVCDGIIKVPKFYNNNITRVVNNEYYFGFGLS